MTKANTILRAAISDGALLELGALALPLAIVVVMLLSYLVR